MQTYSIFLEPFIYLELCRYEDVRDYVIVIVFYHFLNSFHSSLSDKQNTIKKSSLLKVK